MRRKLNVTKLNVNFFNVNFLTLTGNTNYLIFVK